MATMQVILREDVEHLGSSGDLVTVKQGYGRNFLIPQGLAVLANPKNVRALEHEKRGIAARAERLAKNAQAVAGRLAGVTLQIERQVGEEDKLFGSVSARDIEEALAAQGVTVDRRKIQLSEPIKALGQYTVPVKLGGGVAGEIKVWVVAKE